MTVCSPAASIASTDDLVVDLQPSAVAAVEADGTNSTSDTNVALEESAEEGKTEEEEDVDDGFGADEDDGGGGFQDDLDDDDEVDEFDDIDEDDFDDSFDDDFEEELEDDYEIEIDDEISAEFGLGSGANEEAEIEDGLGDFDDFETVD